MSFLSEDKDIIIKLLIAKKDEFEMAISNDKIWIKILNDRNIKGNDIWDIIWTKLIDYEPKGKIGWHQHKQQRLRLFIILVHLCIQKHDKSKILIDIFKKKLITNIFTHVLFPFDSCTKKHQIMVKNYIEILKKHKLFDRAFILMNFQKSIENLKIIEDGINPPNMKELKRNKKFAPLEQHLIRLNENNTNNNNNNNNINDLDRIKMTSKQEKIYRNESSIFYFDRHKQHKSKIGEELKKKGDEFHHTIYQQKKINEILTYENRSNDNIIDYETLDDEFEKFWNEGYSRWNKVKLNGINQKIWDYSVKTTYEQGNLRTRFESL